MSDTPPSLSTTSLFQSGSASLQARALAANTEPARHDGDELEAWGYECAIPHLMQWDDVAHATGH